MHNDRLWNGDDATSGKRRRAARDIGGNDAPVGAASGVPYPRGVAPAQPHHPVIRGRLRPKDDWDIRARGRLSSYGACRCAMVGPAAWSFVRVPHATGDELRTSDWRTVTEYSPAVGTVNGSATLAAAVPCSSAVIGA